MYRAALSIIVGGLGGALVGAALLGVPTYLSNETGFLGPERKFAPIAAVMGLVLGVGPGIGIGIFATLLKPSKLLGAITGAGVGQLALFALVAIGLDPFQDPEIFSIGLIFVPAGALVGLIVAIVANRLDPQRERKIDSAVPSPIRSGRIFDA